MKFDTCCKLPRIGLYRHYEVVVIRLLSMYKPSLSDYTPEGVQQESSVELASLYLANRLSLIRFSKQTPGSVLQMGRRAGTPSQGRD